jgi:hypothetical protein
MTDIHLTGERNLARAFHEIACHHTVPQTTWRWVLFGSTLWVKLDSGNLTPYTAGGYRHLRNAPRTWVLTPARTLSFCPEPVKCGQIQVPLQVYLVTWARIP